MGGLNPSGQIDQSLNFSDAFDIERQNHDNRKRKMEKIIICTYYML